LTGITFQERAVAFIDVLGFGRLVDDAVAVASSKATLESLVALLGAAIPVLNGQVRSSVPTSDIPKSLYVSDSLILSAPATASGSGYDGLSTVVMRTIQVSQLLLGAGFLVRGGIDVGPVWHSDTNVVGPAYQRAYRIEVARSDPGVQLSGAAAAHWGASRLSSSRMCIECDSCLIVNPLEESYFLNASTHGGIEDAYRQYDKTATDAIASFPSVAAKWQWLRRLLEVCAQHYGIIY
jgi:hypothetical protein